MRNRTGIQHLTAASLLFLYQTRTILQLRSYRLRTFPVRLKSSRSSSDDKSKGPPAPKKSFLKSKAGDAKKQHGDGKNKGTTITRAEREVFNNIFADIAGRGEGATGKTVNESKIENAEVDHASILAIFSNVDTSHQSEQRALAQREAARAVQNAGKVDTGDLKKLQQYPKPLRKAARRAQLAATSKQGSDHETLASPVKDTVQDRQRADLDTPNASPAIGSALDGVDSQTRTNIAGEATPEDDTIVPMKKHSASQKHEPAFGNPLSASRRIEDIESFSEQLNAFRPSFIENSEAIGPIEQSLHDPEAMFHRVTNDVCRNAMVKLSNSLERTIDSEGAMGLWNACLSDVFPMIGFLEESFRNEKKMGQRELNRSAQDQEEESSPSPSPIAQESPSGVLDIPPYLPPLYVISRLYPAALLLVLRLFVKHFPTSPLSLALLPEIRSNGATSYVLGASVHFYNTLLSLRWDIYSDMQSVDNLLREMERNGIEFDLGTWEVLAKIGNERAEDLSGKQMRGKLWWQRPQHAKWYQKVGLEWKAVIADRLQERGLGVTTREDDASTPFGAPSRDSSTEQQVWL